MTLWNSEYCVKTCVQNAMFGCRIAGRGKSADCAASSPEASGSGAVAGVASAAEPAVTQAKNAPERTAFFIAATTLDYEGLYPRPTPSATVLLEGIQARNRHSGFRRIDRRSGS